MSRAHNLYRLQQVDQSLHTARTRMDAIRARLADRNDILHAEQFLSEQQTSLRAKQSELKAADDAVATQRAKIKRTETQLYGGGISNPKELQDLHMELESLQRFLAILEDRLLESMLEHEERELERDEAQETLDHLQNQRQKEDAALEQELQQLEIDVERLMGDREEVLRGIDQEDLALYQKLSEKLGVHVVAEVEGDACSICGLALSASASQTVRSGDSLLQCNQCKRILYPK